MFKYIRSLHPNLIDFNLDRVNSVAKKLNILNFFCPVITVTGTNGKGSCVIGLERIYLEAGYTVGSFISPYLWAPNEQIRISGHAIETNRLLSILKVIDQERGDLTLTEFEFYTLASLMYFSEKKPDLLLLEVGMGGRRDAVNIVDPSLAIITNVDIDHTQWLGQTREEIAHEKAGIFRPNIPVVYGENSLPDKVRDVGQEQQVDFYQFSKNFNYKIKKNTWDFHSDLSTFLDLPFPILAIHNMATVLMAVQLLKNKLPVTRDAIEKGIREASLPGRFQKSHQPMLHIFDVAHNPHGAAFLANRLESDGPFFGKTVAVFSMLKDKDIVNSVRCLKESVDEWFIAPLKTSRGASLELLKKSLADAGIDRISCYHTLNDAYQAALKTVSMSDRLLIFGSFHTVSAVYTIMNDQEPRA